MVSPEHLERNYRIIYERLSSQIDVSLEKGNKYIDKELSGFFFAGIRPIVKLFYNSIKRKDMAAGSEKQIDVTLGAAKEAVTNTSKSFEQVLTEYFPKYLEYDQTNLALKKGHPNYRRCVDNLKNTFRSQVEPLIKLLNCDDDDITSYAQLTACTFGDKDTCMNEMERQMQYMNKGIEILAEDLSILNLPVGRDVLFNVLKAGYNETWDDLKVEVRENPYFCE